MKSNKIFIYIIVSIILFPLFIISINLNPYTTKVEMFIKTENKIKKNPYPSSYWDLTGTPIFIDGDAPGVGAHNWTWFETQAWFGGGNGSLSNPYIIENITIDGQSTGSCIYIRDSSKYFVIRNCTLYNSGSIPDQDGGIRLLNVDNGKLEDNNCSYNNANGIILRYSINNTISGNILSENDQCGLRTIFSDRIIIVMNNISHNTDGIFLNSLYVDNIIAYNIINNNYENGIKIFTTRSMVISSNKIHSNQNSGVFIDDNRDELIINNEIYNNDFSGIEIDDPIDTTILRNNISFNEYGIHFWGGTSNKIFKNNVTANLDTGIMLLNSENNNITNNDVNNNNVGIDLQNTNNTIIMENNIINNNLIGLKLYKSNFNNIISNVFFDNFNAVEQIDCKDNNFEGNFGLPPPPDSFPWEIVILIMVCIIITMIAVGMVFYKRKSSSNEEESKKILSSYKLKKEIRKTEAEVSVERETHVCVVHRGKIVGAVYICPECETYYCMKCATLLKEKNENCWACNSKIKL